MPDLGEQLRYLESTKSNDQRGEEFEALLSKVFKDEGFEVHRNPRGATPRQTDLMAVRGDLALLVEAKCHRRKLDVSHIDEVASRLRRTPGDVVGALFSTSGFTRPAIRLAEADRSRETLLFGLEDLAALFEGRTNLLHLIARKREELRLHGLVWFYKPRGKTRPLRIIQETADRLEVGGVRVAHVASAATNSAVVYSLQIPDVSWGVFGGLGVALPLRLDDVESLQDLRAVFAELADRFTLSGSGVFAVHQLQASWFGSGVQGLLSALVSWKDRYGAIGLVAPHHSEHFAYFDKLNDGWVVLTGRQRIDWDRPSWLDSCEILIRLPGSPVDAAPFLRFCRETNNAEARFFPVGGGFRDANDVHTVRPKTKIPLRAVGTIVQKDLRLGDAVRGIIARNPFFGKKRLPSEFLANEGAPFGMLASTELLMCDLADWIDVGDEVDGYELIRAEGIWADDQPIIKVVATWGEIVKRGAGAEYAAGALHAHSGHGNRRSPRARGIRATSRIAAGAKHS